jgi:hypothetical protein
MSTKFNFFTDVNVLDSQTSVKAFGPVSGSLTTKFRVNSLHSASSSSIFSSQYPNPRGYAICIGHVRVFKNSKDPTLLNLVIKPEKTDFNGLPIKYFIYRGIIKSSLCDSNELIIEPGTSTSDPLINAKGTNKLIDDNLVGQSMDKLGFAFGPSATGAFHRADSDPISSLFFEFESDNKPCYVSYGTYLGDFKKSDFSIEVVAGGPTSEPTIGHAKCIDSGVHKFTATEHLIDVTGVTDANELKYRREEILNFLDPVAFYGSMLGNLGLKDFTFNNYQTTPSPAGRTISGPAHYPEQADRYRYYTEALSKFANENRIYLDIRNENNFSLNFYQEYPGSNLKFDLNFGRANQLSAPVYTSFAYETNSWPIKIFSAAEGTDMLAGQPATAVTRQTAIRLNLGIGNAPYSDHVTQRYVYAVHAGMFYKDNTKGIKRLPTNFSLFPNKQRLFQVISSKNHPTDFDYDDVYVATPIIQVPGSGNKLLSYYVKLIYNKQAAPTQPGDTSVKSNSLIDNLFELGDLEKAIGWQPDGSKYNSLYWLTGREKFVQHNPYSIVPDHCMVEAGIAIDYLKGATEDDRRINLFTIPFLYMGQDPSKHYLTLEDFNLMRASEEVSFFGTYRDKIQFDERKKLLYYKIIQPTPHLQLVVSPSENSRDPKSVLAFSMSVKEYNDCKNTLLPGSFNLNYHPVYIQAASIPPSVPDSPPELRFFNLYGVGLNNSGTVESTVMKTGPSAAALEFVGTDNILASQRAVALETQALVINEYLKFLFEASSLTEEANEKQDFRDAIDLITRFTNFPPTKKLAIDTLFLRVQQYISSGKPGVVYHDSPGYKPDTVRFHIKIVMDDSTPAANDYEAGSTQTTPHTGSFYPGGPFLSSNQYVYLNKFVLPTAPAAPSIASFPPQEAENTLLPHTTARNFHNYKLYADKNMVTSFLPSQFDSLFYTDADKQNSVPLSDRFYFETYDFSLLVPGNNPNDSLRAAFTIEEATNRGICAIDKLITIKIKKKFYTHKLDPFNPSTATKTPPRFNNGLGKDPTLGVKPSTYLLAETLIHEIGHAISSIENPIKDTFWNLNNGGIEVAFPYLSELNNPPLHPIVGNSLEGIDADYAPTLPPSDPRTFRQFCIVNNFLMKYGNGHIRGNNTGNTSCGVDIGFSHWFARTNNVIIQDALDPDYNLNLYTPVNTEYCKFNLDNP